MSLIVIGILAAVGILGLVHQMSMLGNTCYYIGELNLQTTSCIPPVAYYGALGVAALLVVIGLVQLLKPKTSTPSN